MDEQEASARVWERFVSLVQRHPWRVRFALFAFAVPVFLFMWLVVPWKAFAIAYAVATLGLLITLDDVTGQRR